MRKLMVPFIFVFLASFSTFTLAEEKYSYVGYINFPNLELRGISVEQLPSGSFEFQKFKHQVVIQSGVVPIATYISADPSRPNDIHVFIGGLYPNNTRALFNCGYTNIKSGDPIQCNLTGAPALFGSGISGGRSLNGIIVTSVVTRGAQRFNQGFRFNPSFDRINSKYAVFEAPFREFPGNTILSQSMSWDSTLAAESTSTAQFIIRNLSTQNGAGKGKSKAYNYDPSHRVVSLALSARYDSLGSLSKGNAVGFIEQRGVGTANPQSSTWVIFTNEDLSLAGPAQMISPWKKTGNTDAQLFSQVGMHEDVDYIVHAEWLAQCDKFGLAFVARNPDGTLRNRKKFETCATLQGGTVGVLGISVSPTYESD